MHHVIYSNFWGTQNLFDLDQPELDKVIEAYNYGKKSFFIRGTKHSFDRLRLIKVYEAKHPWEGKKITAQQLQKKGFIGGNIIGKTGFLNLKGMDLFGIDVTKDFITMNFGELEEKSKEIVATTSDEEMEPKKEIKFDYAIITALYKDELKYIEPYINYVGEIVEDDRKLIRYGTLKTNTDINIVYASLLNTGMVDAAIVATDIITQFNPRILFMPGVCGGKDIEALNLEDIIVATKVFTFQKGKLKEDGFHGEWEGVDMNDKLIQKIQAEEDNIIGELHFKGAIHYEPMACSTAVIDKGGVFEMVAELKDRKTLGLEMEGYGIARACQIANNGNTKALIIKSVMDKTSEKNDDVKKEAAQNSANFVMKIIEMEII